MTTDNPWHSMPLDGYAELYTALASGATLLTSTNRLARRLRGAFDQHMLDSGQQTWDTPSVLPWGTWLGQVYEQLIDADQSHALLLNSTQEQLIWSNLIAASEEGRALLRPQASAEAVSNAYALLQTWRIPEDALASYATLETETFLSWVAQFHEICESSAWLPQADLSALVESAYASQQLTPPGQLVLAGFDEWIPEQRALLSVLSEIGTRISEFIEPSADHPVRRYVAKDPESEISDAARWALTRLQAKPNGRIGIVVPDLSQRRDALERGFTRILQPESQGLEPVAAAPFFEFSLGEPLDAYPLVNDALLALGLLVGERPLQDYDHFLGSPFFAGGDSEWTQRGQVNAHLRRYQRATPGIGLLQHVLEHSAPRPRKTSSALTQALEIIERLPDRAPPSAWTNHFDQLLKALGWPGERTLDSNEYQAVSRFRELYTTFVELDLVSGPLNYRNAMQLLRRVAAGTVFQPKSLNAPIQIMGVLEAGGMTFDHIWVMGLDDARWPPPPAPHPLLPGVLQRQLGLPHASAERELAFAARLTSRLGRMSPETVFSHAQVDADRALRVSPLIANLTEVSVQDLNLAPAESEPLAATPLQELSDDQAMPPDATLKGGTQLLAAQSRCPFSALATFRLRAEALSEPIHAPDARLGGTLIHALMDLIWRELDDQQALLTIEDAQLTQLIDQAVDSALGEARHLRPDLYSTPFVQLERERLRKLARDWLALERQRAPFSVTRREVDTEIELESLRLKVRADRIDTLEDGSLVVIDYKTAKKFKVDDWTEPRIGQPQVPLYCVTASEPVAAATIARVRSDGSAFEGLSRDDALLPGVKAFEGEDTIPDWGGLQQHWHQVLGMLAREVGSGLATATPSDQACRYCEHGPLCRVYDAPEKDQPSAEEEDV